MTWSALAHDEKSVDPNRYNITFVGICETCVIRVEVTGEGASTTGNNFLGQKRESDCLNCGSKMELITVGLTIDPYHARIDEEDDEETDEELVEDQSDDI